MGSGQVSRVDARLEEIFELVNKELKSIGRAAKLPGGAVLTGGGAQLSAIADYAKHALQLSARVGHTQEFAGVSDKVASPAWSTALGLMLIDLESQNLGTHHGKKAIGSNKPSLDITNLTKKITGVFGRFRT
jgi:cell division protein FtsA